MKQTALIAVVLLLFAVSVTGADKSDKSDKSGRKKINIVGAMGVAGAVFEDVMFDLGIELQLSRNFYIQVVTNSHMGDGRRGYYDPYGSYPYYGGYFGGRNSVSLGFSLDSIHGVTTYGVFKAAISRKLSFFTKGGAGFIFYSRDEADYHVQSIRRFSYNGFSLSAGAGLDYELGKKVGLVFGGTYKYLLRKYQDWEPGDNTLDWLKLYMGAYYRVK